MSDNKPLVALAIFVSLFWMQKETLRRVTKSRCIIVKLDDDIAVFFLITYIRKHI